FYPRTDLGNAERFVARHRGLLMWCEPIGWIWWDKRRWARDHGDNKVRDAEHATVRAIQLEAKALAASDRDQVVETKREPIKLSEKLVAWGRTSEMNGRITAIEQNARSQLAVDLAELDADPLQINLANGTLVVRRSWSNDAAALLPGWRRISDYIRLKPH